jgi:hypothetical protein
MSRPYPPRAPQPAQRAPRTTHIAALAGRPNRCLRAIIVHHHDQSVRRGSSVAMHVAESS